jgi:DNA-binding response OmpR family regulator
VKILVIEDGKMLCETILSYLEGEGYRCEQSRTLELGIEKVNLYEYDCVLVDIGLPDRNGLTLIRELKKLTRKRGLSSFQPKTRLMIKSQGLI